jgi:hypothetical protein
MESWFDFLYGPLDKKYCNVFLFLSFVSLLSILLVLTALVVSLFRVKKLEAIYYLNLVWLLVMSSIGYLAYRLLYNLCIKK